MKRFEKQICLEGFGTEAQEKLRSARILVIGAGGLGCPALLYLAAAGIGAIGIADGDCVELSNLNRQVLFGEKDLSKNKALVAAAILSEKYSDIKLEAIPEFLNNQNILPVLERFDFIIDGTDNFSARYLINDACMLLKKPWVSGAIYRNEGQIAMFNPFSQQPVCYRDVFSVPPATHEIPDCNLTGVLGVLPGIIGTMQAAETIKWITGYGKSIEGKMMVYNLLNQEWMEVMLVPKDETKNLLPHTTEEFMSRNYTASCNRVPTITWSNAIKTTELQNESAWLVDVRNADEKPDFHNPYCHHIPLSEIKSRSKRLADATQLFVFCRTGIRSAEAVKIMKEIFPDKNIFSIEGGLLHSESPINIICHES